MPRYMLPPLAMESRISATAPDQRSTVPNPVTWNVERLERAVFRRHPRYAKGTPIARDALQHLNGRNEGRL
jgi:hypothetical protein